MHNWDIEQHGSKIICRSGTATVLLAEDPFNELTPIAPIEWRDGRERGENEDREAMVSAYRAAREWLKRPGF